ncbi:hypothetical protein SAMN04487969_108140 [Paenibacillus algorifonticola]|uniref:Uncharacterized protein n=1 Tax=Paenibacillus algorifonticola TaxID=684063 RepID=A0A1I2E455_9BACL|nr:hypothetical protein [Paenibacillus algorifonticola]SFE87000.1 hypothetical protein SAMN04487969_108140 [Paenibacillus algorifonticola]
MINSKFKLWLQLAASVKETTPNAPKLECPSCSSANINFEYIGDAIKRKGYFLMWCNDCLKGIHISRIEIPEKAKVIPFGATADQTSHIPNFTKVLP